MILRLLLAHVGIAIGIGVLAALRQRRPFRLSWGLLDAAIALALPVLGPLLVLGSLALEAGFRRKSPRPAEGDPAEEEPGRLRDVDPLEEMRIGTSVAPLAEVLALGDLEEVDRTLRRLIESDRPSVLRLLQDALQSPRLDVRVRARGLLVRVEDRLMKVARGAGPPLDRARALRKLGCLSADPVTVRLHLRGAAEAYGAAIAADPESPAGGEWGRVLLLLGEDERARDVLTRHLDRHPDDANARLARAQASLRASDVPAARRDCAALHLPALE